jgi:hypothetical protein
MCSIVWQAPQDAACRDRETRDMTHDTHVYYISGVAANVRHLSRRDFEFSWFLGWLKPPYTHKKSTPILRET